MPGILFVCTANICRSPMAEGMFKKFLQDRNEAGEWIVDSAGTWGFDGEPAALGSQTVMSEMGIDISNHSARRVNFEILRSFDLILTMESGHKEALQIEFPEISDRVYMLSEMMHEQKDIPDPIGGPIAEYETTANLIEQYLLNGYEEIRILSGSAKQD